MNTPTHRFKDRQTECWSYPRMSIFQDAMKGEEDYFSFLDESPRDGQPLRLYLHIPYCKQFCVFCPYYKKVYGASDQSEKNILFEAFAREIAMYAARPQIAGRKLATIYFGGGDPGVISIEEHEIIWKALRSHFDWAPHVDITVEGTALSFLDREKLSYFKEKGVTRTSFGIQTFDEGIRPQLNLEPTLGQIYEAAQNIKDGGFCDFNVDMMYNLPGQSHESFLRDIERVREIAPKYVDFYALNLYPNTVYLNKVRSGAYGTKPKNETEISQWREIMRIMGEAGWNQVSSVTFSRTETVPHLGFDHTLQGFPMLGIGPSSRSYVAGRNYRNHASTERYVEDVTAGRLPVETGSTYSQETVENWPFVFFPIRLYLDWATVEASPRNRAIVLDLVREGFLERTGDRVVLTEEGRVWVGNIQRAFFDEEERQKDRASLFEALKTRRNPYNQDFMGVGRAPRAEGA